MDFSVSVGQWWTWFRIVVVCVALGGAFYAWAKPAITGKMDNQTSKVAKPENVGRMKRMLTMLCIAAGVWWLTSDDGISFVGDVFSMGEATATDMTSANAPESPIAETEWTVRDGWFEPTATTEVS